MPDRIIETLNDVRLLLRDDVLLLWQEIFVCFPVVRRIPLAWNVLHFLPELPTSGLSTSTTLEGERLSAVSIKSKPDPEF